MIRASGNNPPSMEANMCVVPGSIPGWALFLFLSGRNIGALNILITILLCTGCQIVIYINVCQTPYGISDISDHRIWSSVIANGHYLCYLKFSIPLSTDRLADSSLSRKRRENWWKIEVQSQVRSAGHQGMREQTVDKHLFTGNQPKVVTGKESSKRAKEIEIKIIMYRKRHKSWVSWRGVARTELFSSSKKSKRSHERNCRMII